MDELEEEVVENPTLRAAFSLAPLHQNQPLQWDYEVHLIGDKIYDKPIHLCELCELPILVYGRMLPCKHIFCFDCARKSEKACRRCNGKVQKVEKSALGTVYVCTHGAPRHDMHGCRRTYLSQRDLQSHIAHRHQPKSTSTKHVSSNSQAAQPAPVQMPLTQQQAAQQASQKIVTSVQSHLQTSNIAVQSLLPVSSLAMTHSQSSGLAVSAQQMSPIQPHIPGLGDLRQSPVVLGQNSPLAQPGQSSNTLQQGLGLPYSSGQSNPDIYRSLELASLAQQPPQLQQGLGINSMHLASIQNIQQYSQTSQFPVSTPLLPQMAQGLVAPLHNMPMSHQHSSLPVQQNLDSYTKSPSVQSPLSTPQSRNLITVPIQDEGQYRPISYIPAMSSQSNNPGYQQNRPLTSNSFSNPSSFNLLNAPNQSQNISHSSALGGPSQNMGHMGGSSAQNIGHGSNLGGQSQNLVSQVSNLVSLAQNMGHPQNLGGQGQNMPGVNSGSQGMQYSPVSGMQSNNSGMMINQRSGGGHPRPLMSTPGVNRFQQSHWQNPRVIQSRMNQGTQRPRQDNQFNHGKYYS